MICDLRPLRGRRAGRKAAGSGAFRVARQRDRGMRGDVDLVDALGARRWLRTREEMP